MKGLILEEKEDIEESENVTLINGDSTNLEDYKITINDFLAYEIEVKRKVSDKTIKVKWNFIHNDGMTADLVYSG